MQVMLILILINDQYFLNIVFCFKKGLNGQNHSLPDSHHLIKKSPQPFKTFWKTLMSGLGEWILKILYYYIKKLNYKKIIYFICAR